VDNGADVERWAHLRRARTLVWPVLPLAAAAWWVGGALPWTIEGLGAGSPRDWPYDARTGSASDGYIRLLPFTTTSLGLLLTITLVGGALAALAVLWVRARPGKRLGGRLGAVALALLGAVVSSAYAIAQSAGATRQLGSDFDRDERVLLGVLAVAVGGTVIGLVLGLLVVLARPVLRALAAAPLAVAVGSWVSALAVGLLGAERAKEVLHWSPVVVGAAAGLALAALGLRPARRLFAWVAVLLLVAVCAAGETAFSYLTSYLRPRSGLPNGLRDYVEASRDVFLEALRPQHQVWGLYVIAVVVGLLGSMLPWRHTDDPPAYEKAARSRVGRGSEPTPPPRSQPTPGQTPEQTPETGVGAAGHADARVR